MHVYIAVLLVNFIKLIIFFLKITLGISDFLLLILIIFHSILVISVSRVKIRLCLTKIALDK